MLILKRFVCFIYLLGFSISFAQFNNEIPQAEEYSNPSAKTISREPIWSWSKDTSSIRLIVIYRLNPKFFFFIRANNSQEEIYEAKGELDIEIINDEKNTVARDFRMINIEQKTPIPEANIRYNKLEGAFVFTLVRGKYQIVLEAKDFASGKTFTDRNLKLDLQSPPSSNLNISNPTLVESIVIDSFLNTRQIFYPINYSGDIIIGMRGGCLFQVITSDTVNDIDFSWRISGNHETEEIDTQRFHGESFIQEYGSLKTADNTERASLEIIKDTKHSRVVYISLPLQRLEKGEYRLKITATQDTIRTSNEIKFNVRWPHQPHSLSSLKLAIRALKHIATAEEIDQMSTLNSDKSKKLFNEFWQRQNPDTLSAYNPRMAEYYRRVDEAIKRYSNNNEMDGYRTDRGRIYILFGSPSVTNRLLKPGSSPTEIWTYEKLRQRFTFIDREKTGNYILIKEEKF